VTDPSDASKASGPLRSSAAAQSAGVSGAAEPTEDETVNRIIDTLLAQPAQAIGSGARSRGATGAAPVSRGNDTRASRNLRYLVAARRNDPSYVFFQPAASGGSGPVGALGVPLTATRSIAVDPRSTPLGAPVFIEAERDDAAEPLRRLMIAQDTGGAIRGAVRADFFWGTGPKAGAQALRTKDDLAMWVLLPKDFKRPRATGTRTRGIGGSGAATASECVIPDAEYCVD
jgi:membrane-bound lytic murein transglycosylase A